MRRSARVVMVFVPLAALLGASAALTQPALATSTAHQLYLVDQAANNLATAEADPLNTKFATDPTFAGAVITKTGVEVNVVGAPSPALEAEIAKGKTAPIQIRQVRNSLPSLAAVSNDLTRRYKQWKSRGIDMSTWAANFYTNKVEVSLLHYTASAAAMLTAAYGPALLHVAGSSASVELSDRTTDTSPFFGADSIIMGVQACTTWFGSKSNAHGYPYQLTAAHCGAGTWKVSFGGSLGASLARKFGGLYDVEDFSVSIDPYVYADPNYSERGVAAIASGDSPGGLVCTDGGSDREVCSVKILTNSAQFSYDGEVIGDLVEAEQTADQDAFTPGDSGAPVYSTNADTSVVAHGMLVAHTNGDYTGFYEKVSNVEAAMGVTVALCGC